MTYTNTAGYNMTRSKRRCGYNYEELLQYHIKNVRQIWAIDHSAKSFICQLYIFTLICILYKYFLNLSIFSAEQILGTKLSNFFTKQYSNVTNLKCMRLSY